MVGLTENEKKALKLFKEQLLAEFGERVDSTQLFGSKARGDAAKHSDVDVLVVLRTMTWRDKRAVRAIAADVIFATDVVLSVQVLSKAQLADLKHRKALFWQLIQPDLTVL